ncbi:MAG: hypothetical protein N2C14_03790 [Planctomycetales bacterium]
MSDASDINAIKSQTLALIQQLHENPKPSYSIDGQSVQWEQMLAGLERTVDWCDRKLQEYQPFQEETQAYT